MVPAGDQLGAVGQCDAVRSLAGRPVVHDDRSRVPAIPPLPHRAVNLLSESQSGDRPCGPIRHQDGSLTRDAPHAAMLATSVWIYTRAEPDVRAVVGRDDGAGRVPVEAGRGEGVVRIAPAVPLHAEGLEAVGRVVRGAAAVDGEDGEVHRGSFGGSPPA